MTDFKSFLQSKTIWGALIGLVALLLELLGYKISPVDQGLIAEKANEIIALGGTLLAIYGRIVATKQIGSK